jgi:allantoate deiminase
MNRSFTDRALQIIDRCQMLARCTDVPGEITRLFLDPSMHDVHRLLRQWMEVAGMTVRVDAAGNLRGLYPGAESDAPRLLIASHVDTVPNAGAYDGILGVVLGISVIEELRGQKLPFAIEVIGFSEEEGVRFSKPFLGSLALIGGLDTEILARADQSGITVADAICAFGLNPLDLEDARIDTRTFAYLEFHIEQGPVLESENRSLGVVEAIVGQTRLQLVFTGHANHAGTTPMRLRHDALAAAAHWIVEVEQYARQHDGLVATVGRISAKPDASNIIPGEVIVSLDVRHAHNDDRHTSVSALLACAEFAATSRGVRITAQKLHDQPAVPMAEHLVAALAAAAERAGTPAIRMTSGAGHDAMILAEKVPAVMLFLRSPAGLSHHPEESVLPGDVEAALATAMEFLKHLHENAAVS